jgi:hypothetical protein
MSGLYGSTFVQVDLDKNKKNTEGQLGLAMSQVIKTSLRYINDENSRWDKNQQKRVG